MEVPIETCISAKVYSLSVSKRIFWISLAVAAYSISLPFAYLTIGEPREAAILRVQNLEDSKWVTDINETKGIKVMDASQDHDHSGPNTTASDEYLELSTSSTNDELNISDEEFEQLLASTPPVSSGWFSSWSLTDDQKRIKRIVRVRTENLHRKLKEASRGEDIILPPWYLPSAWACLTMAITLTFHALFHLLCIWSVEFRAFATLTPVKSKVHLNHIVLVKPPINRGKSEFVSVSRAPITGELKIDFQRQSYTYSSPERMGSRGKDYSTGVFFLASSPISLSLDYYVNSTGFKSATDVERAQELWGSNHLSLPTPSFLLLLKEQLVRPLSIFQLFCALLWLLDEYWTYTLWTLVSVIVFEAVTVFQRTKTLKMLGGMAPKASFIHVFRSGKWVIVSTHDLLPGDLISITQRFSGGSVDDKDNAKTNNGNSNIIPCDCLLLTGAAVVNEASLTGESIPQMKEAVQFFDEDSKRINESKLDIYDAHRVSTLFSGTTLITVSVPNVQKGLNGRLEVSSPPDIGAVAYVLRTGFSSSQGNLLQMIEFSQEKVSGDSKETGFALLMLLCFALVASGYVLREGLRKNEKSTHEILLKCVIIITSVVPRQLPMQMAMAVNMAITALMKTGIFCTEPYRVPLAGKISHCLFDKTGTLTTDQLVPVGVVNVGSGAEILRNLAQSEWRQEKNKIEDVLEKVRDADNEAAMVLAACHSLVDINNDPDNNNENEGTKNGNNEDVDGKMTYIRQKSSLVGDPIELAAIEGVEWSWNPLSSTATPGRWEYMEKALNVLECRLENARKDMATKSHAPGSGKHPEQIAMGLQKSIDDLRQKLEEVHERANHCKYKSVRVVQRHYFSSNLQRMSVLCHITPNILPYDEKDCWYCLVKGSPEKILSLLIPDSIPVWYTECYTAMARKGLRVLALAYKKLDLTEMNRQSDEIPSISRERAESNLRFCGFISFECKVRADSLLVIKSLVESDHTVTMLTGDSPLTSIHVAKEVNICGREGKTICMLVTDSSLEEGSKVSLENLHARWIFTDSEGKEQRIPFSLQSTEDGCISNMSKHFDLVTTEGNFLQITNAAMGLSDTSMDGSAALAVSDTMEKSLWREVGNFRVFARMSPQGKRCVISALQKATKTEGVHVLMCGDGGNDVGALKQADVGVALLTGHANANTSENIEGTEGISQSRIDEKLSAEDTLNAHGTALKDRGATVNKMREAHMKVWQAEYMKRAQEEMQQKIKEYSEKGEWMATFSLMKEQAANSRIAIQSENKRFMAQHGHIWDPKSTKDTNIASENDLMSLLGIDLSQGSESDSPKNGEVPVIRPGDASVAAPFTSKIPSVRAVIDLIRQGRCTLLSALMQQQIMMLESIIAAYTLSALSLHNARSSERQMMASSWLIMTAAVAFSYASPVDKMHPQRPLSSLFHPAIIFSILGQAVIHIACMTLAVQWATDAMGTELLQEVTEFFKKAKAKQLESQYLCDEDDFMCNFNQLWFTPFMPNLLNSVVFLVETSQMISVFFANYKGRPWMKGMLENHPLFLSVFLCIAGVVVASWEMVPQFNEVVQLAPFPNDEFRYKVVFLVVATIAGTFLWDRLCTLLFAPKIFDAMAKEAIKTTWKDIVPVLMTLLKIIIGVLILGSGNIILWGIAFYIWRQMNKKKDSDLNN